MTGKRPPKKALLTAADLEQEKIFSVLELMPTIVYLQDASFSILFANRIFRQLFGDPAGKTCYQILKGQSNPCKNCAVKSVLQNKAPQQWEWTSADGLTYIIHVNLFPSFEKTPLILAVGIDISARKRVEEALRASELKYRQLIQRSGDAFYVLYNRKFEIINDKFQKMFGVTLEEVNAPEFDFMQLVAPRSRAYLEERMRRFKSGEKVELTYEFTGLSKEGKEIELETTVSYIKYKDGIATQGILRDLTERKRLEEQVRQSQKMKAIGTLASGVAHDFNNLLTVILGNTELLLYDLQENHPLYQDIFEVKKAANRAASLTRQLLAFSRKQPLQKVMLNINSLVIDMEKMLKRLIGEDIELITDLDPKLRRTFADVGQIEQVMMNLAVNAYEAMPNGGKLIIKTANIYIDESYCRVIQDARPGLFVCLSIQDTGRGISNEIIGQIFDPFFSTKEAGNGTGLGLSVVFGIVKQHDGWINVYSELGHGTIFKVYLPIFSIESALEPADKSAQQRFRGNGERILLVEDEAKVLNFAVKTLQKYGYQVFEANCAEEARCIFEREKGNFQLIFSDVVLPDHSGLDLVNDLLVQKPAILVLLTSGYTEQKSQWSTIREKGFRYLQKPYTVGDLLQIVYEILNEPNQNNQK